MIVPKGKEADAFMELAKQFGKTKIPYPYYASKGSFLFIDAQAVSIKSRKTFYELSCTCRQKKCPHMAGALYYLIFKRLSRV